MAIWIFKQTYKKWWKWNDFIKNKVKRAVIMVLNLINTSTAMGWSLKTIYEMPTVTVNDTNNVRKFLTKFHNFIWIRCFFSLYILKLKRCSYFVCCTFYIHCAYCVEIRNLMLTAICTYKYLFLFSFCKISLSRYRDLF